MLCVVVCCVLLRAVVSCVFLCVVLLCVDVCCVLLGVVVCCCMLLCHSFNKETPEKDWNCFRPIFPTFWIVCIQGWKKKTVFVL